MADASQLTQAQFRVVRSHVATKLAGDDYPEPDQLVQAERLMEAGFIDIDEVLPKYQALGGPQ